MKKTGKIIIIISLAVLLCLAFTGCKGTGNDPSGGNETYAVTNFTSELGNVTAGKNTGLRAGDTVTLTVTPAANAALKAGSLKANWSGGSILPAGTPPVFKMPAGNVTIAAVFEAKTIVIIDNFEAEIGFGEKGFGSDEAKAEGYFSWAWWGGRGNGSDEVYEGKGAAVLVYYPYGDPGLVPGGWNSYQCGATLGRTDIFINLSECTKITFWAKAANENETVTFYLNTYAEDPAAWDAPFDYMMVFTPTTEWSKIEIPFASFLPAYNATTFLTSWKFQVRNSSAKLPLGGKLCIDNLRAE